MRRQKVECVSLCRATVSKVAVGDNLRIHPEHTSATKLQKRFSFIDLQCSERSNHVLEGRLSWCPVVKRSLTLSSKKSSLEAVNSNFLLRIWGWERNIVTGQVVATRDILGASWWRMVCVFQVLVSLACLRWCTRWRTCYSNDHSIIKLI